MGTWIAMAARGAVRNKKQSILIGAAICFSTVLLLASRAAGNGAGEQIVGSFRTFWAGDVVAFWKEVKTYPPTDPSRLYYSTFEAKEDQANRRAIQRLVDFLARNQEDVDRIEISIKAPGTLDTGQYTAWIIVVGLDPSEYDLLSRAGMLVLAEGQDPFSDEYGICVSRTTAAVYGLSLGDWPTIDVTTKDGYTNTYDYKVTGIYRNNTEFDGTYVYLSRRNALDLLDWGPTFFSTVRIFLRAPSRSAAFAQALDAHLLESSDVLRAESFEQASWFHRSIARYVNLVFTLFVCFLFCVIALGVRGTVRMSLFQRQAEFGTLRALGFGRKDVLALVFLEVLLLALVSSGAGLAITTVLVTVLGRTGVHTGSGTLAVALNDEYLYPALYPMDVIVLVCAITVFSLFASLKPSLGLCRQRITDLLARNQKPLFAVPVLLKRLLGRARIPA